MDTIRELFYGNIHPFERDVPKNSEGDRLNHLINSHTATLKATLNEQEAETLEKLKDALSEQSVNFALAAPLARSFCTTVTEKQHHPHGETAPPSRTSCTTENIDYTQRKWYHKLALLIRRIGQRRRAT